MKQYTEKGAAHIVLIGVIILVVVLLGVFIIKNSSLKITKDGQTVVDTNSTDTSPKNDKSDSVKKTDDDAKPVRDLVKEHFKDVYNRDLDAAYAVTCDYFRDFTSREDFESIVGEGIFKAIDLSQIDYSEADVASSQARLRGKIGPLMPDSKLEVDFLKENNKWCIAGYRTL